MTLRPVSAYAREIKPLLPARAFEPARSRLLWLPLHTAVIVLGMYAMVRDLPSPWLYPVISLVLGCSFAGLVFLAHETLHGATVRELRLRQLVGWFGFLPFVVSPRLWIAWHNRVHHGNANHSGADPDAYPTLAEHRESSLVRVSTDWFGIGRRRLRGLVSLCLGFSFQSAHVLFTATRRGYLTPRAHRLAAFETGLAVLVWIALAFALGPLPFLVTCVAPLVVANALVMAHIFTNHALSPLTPVNDPLANSLTVTVPPLVEWLTLGFGYHVEHHLFPWMSARHAPAVRELVISRWPERYQSLPLLEALLRVHRTPRVYADDTTLVDPATGARHATLAAHAAVTPPPANPNVEG
ncbi:MAG TPA: fatty acid desaturase [Polyangiaceae bacterium]